MRTIPAKAWALTVLSAMLQLLPFPLAGPVPLWRRAFCWICLVPLLVALSTKDKQGRRLRLGQMALLGYLCGCLWYAGNCYWIYQTMNIYGSIPALPSLGILLLFSLYLGLYLASFAVGFGYVQRACPRWVALLCAPALWVSLELARGRITGFPWDLLGYAQVDNFWLGKLAPVGGVMLISFVIATVNALLAGAIGLSSRALRWRWAAAVVAAALLLQLGVLRQPAADAAAHTAVLLQENLAVGAQMRELAPISEGEKYRQFYNLSLHPVAPSDGMTTQRPEFIVWPEAPADFATSDPAFRENLGALARAASAPVIAGSIGIDMDPAAEHGYHEFGSAAVFGSNGEYRGRYDKIHRVPWGEYVPYKSIFGFAGKLISGVGNMEAGTQHKLFALNGHSVGIFICYESIFGDEVRQFVRGGADVLVNISDDGWYGDSGAPWQHLDMERMRAIENRRWILRDTNTGITTSIDPHGRGDFNTPRHTREAFVFPFGYTTEKTFYTLHGDWFAWVCVLLSMALVLCTWLKSTKRDAGRV
jgi:apolipoprotein N-acyltransferase